MAYLKRVIQIFLLAFLASWIWLSFNGVLTGHDFSSEVEKIILKGKKSNIIDLTQLQPKEWDELAIWYPYSDVRELKIDGIFLLFESRYTNQNDGSNVLLFLKNNRIKGHAVFNRTNVDFATFEPGHRRIPRNKAIFKFNGSVDFSTVQFLEKK